MSKGVIAIGLILIMMNATDIFKSLDLPRIILSSKAPVCYNLERVAEFIKAITICLLMNK